MFASDKLIATSVFNSVFLAIYLRVGFVMQPNDVWRKFWQMREMSHELVQNANNNYNTHTHIYIYKATHIAMSIGFHLHSHMQHRGINVSLLACVYVCKIFFVCVAILQRVLFAFFFSSFTHPHIHNHFLVALMHCLPLGIWVLLRIWQRLSEIYTRVCMFSVVIHHRFTLDLITHVKLYINMYMLLYASMYWY